MFWFLAEKIAMVAKSVAIGAHCELSRCMEEQGEGTEETDGTKGTAAQWVRSRREDSYPVVGRDAPSRRIRAPVLASCRDAEPQSIVWARFKFRSYFAHILLDLENEI